MLGVGFEERGEALDFSIALQEARKVLGMAGPVVGKGEKIGKAPMGSGRDLGRRERGGRMGGGVGVGVGAADDAKVGADEARYVKRDLSLKEGQMLNMHLPGTKRDDEAGKSGIEPPSGGGLVSPAGSGFALLPPPPPPSGRGMRDERHLQRVDDGDGDVQDEKKTLEEMGFDDGEFGEFQ